MNPEIPLFTGTPGLQVDLPDNPDVMDFVKLFLPNDFYEMK